MTQTMTGNGRTQRKSLATEIDRLDGILDGLDDALAGSVETAVRDVVGQVVRETVEATIREVLTRSELIQAALARHLPVAAAVPQSAPARRTTLGQWLKEKLAPICRAAGEKAGRAVRNLASAWKWVIRKVAAGSSWAWGCCKSLPATADACLRSAWRHRIAVGVALGVGTTLGVGAFLAGPIVAGVISGLSGASAAAVGTVLWPLWRLLSGRRA